MRCCRCPVRRRPAFQSAMLQERGGDLKSGCGGDAGHVSRCDGAAALDHQPQTSSGPRTRWCDLGRDAAQNGILGNQREGYPIRGHLRRGRSWGGTGTRGHSRSDTTVYSGAPPPQLVRVVRELGSPWGRCGSTPSSGGSGGPPSPTTTAPPDPAAGGEMSTSGRWTPLGRAAHPRGPIPSPTTTGAWWGPTTPGTRSDFPGVVSGGYTLPDRRLRSASVGQDDGHLSG